MDWKLSTREQIEYDSEALLFDVQYDIHRLLKDKNVSQSELARRLGVSKSRISQILSDEGVNLTLKTVGAVFSALGEACELVSPRLLQIKGRVHRINVSGGTIYGPGIVAESTSASSWHWKDAACEVDCNDNKNYLTDEAQIEAA